MTDYIELPAPHGFLIWRGKQTAIASTEPIPYKQLLITSNDEAFGYATLSEQPTVLNAKTFDTEEYYKEHCTSPEERKLVYGEDISQFYLYRIVNWQPFKELKPFIDGVIVEDALSDSQLELIEQSKRLPKEIILDKCAVTFDGENFTSEYVQDYVAKVLGATYGIDAKANGPVQDSDMLALYRLALVRVPNPYVVKKNDDKQIGDDMPWSIELRDDEYCVVKDDDGEVEGCHATEEEAEAQRTALNIAEAERAVDSEPATATKQEESISQFVERVHQQFGEMFREEREDYFYAPYVCDVYDSHVIADDDGLLYRVNYMDTESGMIMFADRGAWVEVEQAYVDKAAKLLKHYDNKATASWRDKFKQAARTVMDFVNGTEEDAKESILDAVDLSKPYGIAVKTVDGEPWHFTWSTNAFEDREGEIFSIQALKNYVEEAEKLDSRGTFDFWHLSNTDFAKKEWQYIPEGSRFLIEAGPYLDNEIGKKAREFFQEYPDSHPEIAPEGWGASPEFRYLQEDRTDGVYDWLWITRTSTLPKSAAANIWTKGSQIMSNAQRDAGVKIWGEDFVKTLDELAAKETESLEAAGVGTKANGEESPEDTVTENELDLNELAKALSEHFSVNLDPMAEAIETIGRSVAELKTRLDKVEKIEAVKTNNEVPRFMFNLVQRASESEDTEVKDGDGLKDKKPIESKGQFDTASAFFNNR